MVNGSPSAFALSATQHNATQKRDAFSHFKHQNTQHKLTKLHLKTREIQQSNQIELSSYKSKQKKQMYPRVKVKEQDRDDQHAMQDYRKSSVLSLKDVQFLSMLDSYFPVKRHQDVSPVPTARIPESYVPEIEKPSDSVSEEAEKNKEKTDEEVRPSIRVSSTPRPRAVISSPENDAVIGNKNKMKGEHRTALKNHNMAQNRHTTGSHIFARSPPKTRKSKDDADNNSELNGKKGSGTTVSSRRRRLKTERPSWQDP